MRCVWNDMYNVKMWEEEKGRVEVRVTKIKQTSSRKTKRRMSPLGRKKKKKRGEGRGEEGEHANVHLVTIPFSQITVGKKKKRRETKLRVL